LIWLTVSLSIFLLQAPVPQDPAFQQEHPVPLGADSDAAKCVECHAEKAEGKFVHTAIAAMGCTACHQVKTENETTLVNLTEPRNRICFSCHEVSQDKVKHGPYWKGDCTFCHDPHTSTFASQTRAETNRLCLSCHSGLPDMKVDREAKTLTFSWGRSITFDQARATPQLGLVNGRQGHPLLGHPVEGPNKFGKPGDPPITCLTCHQPHSSALPNLMPADVKRDIDICTKCHR